MSTTWRKWPDEQPPESDRERISEDVLIYVDGEILVAHTHLFTGEDAPVWVSWASVIEGVTYWAELPAPPEG